MKKRIILASASPRRKEILSQVNINFDIITSDCEEIVNTTKPDELVINLSNIKAESVLDKALSNGIGDYEEIVVIGADTVVSNNNQILGKPKDKQDAYNMIYDIQNNVHQVYTGVTIYSYILINDEMNNHIDDIICKISSLDNINVVESNSKYIKICASFAVRTDVYVNAITEEEIQEYINSNEPYDKAGGYGIQGAFAKYIEKISGDYYNVVGLPVSKVYSVINLIS